MRNVFNRLTRTEDPVFVLPKLLGRPGLFGSGAVQLAHARPASAYPERRRITITDVRLASLGIALNQGREVNPHNTLNRKGRP